MKSNPFLLQRTIPFDVSEGSTFINDEGEKFKITKIKQIKFIDMRTVQITGLCVDA